VAAEGSTKVVLAALAGNSLIAITKFVAAAWTGSSAMLSEAIHSVVDTSNQGLILYGMKRSQLPADAKHPFGYSREIYFWCFVVAVMLFGLGAGVSAYEGYEKLSHPEPIKNAYVAYIVLGLAILFEGFSFFVAWKEFNHTRGDLPLMDSVRRSKNPVVFTVLFEDMAAMAGLVIALIGTLFADLGGYQSADGIASLAIAGVLALTAVILSYETKGLLIGEGASEDVVRGIRKIVSANPGVQFIHDIRTMQLGPNDVLLIASLDFADRLSSTDVERIAADLERDVRARYPEVRRAYFEAEGIPQARLT
jgi:cation diffusion facilitator family transporter